MHSPTLLPEQRVVLYGVVRRQYMKMNRASVQKKPWQRESSTFDTRASRSNVARAGTSQVYKKCRDFERAASSAKVCVPFHDRLDGQLTLTCPLSTVSILLLEVTYECNVKLQPRRRHGVKRRERSVKRRSAHLVHMSAWCNLFESTRRLNLRDSKALQSCNQALVSVIHH